ncbi:MAG: hypothetical protein ACQETH_09365 [Candidatus Rifleibacteriota bacterium]
MLMLGSSHIKPKYLPIEAGVKTHPTTSRPWDYPATPEGYPLIIADQVDFVSYLSSTITGNIKIKANYETLSPVEVSIRLKQPKISIKLNKLDSVSDSLLVPEWKNVVINTWSKESLFFVDFLNSSPDTFSNEILSDPTHLPNSYESNLIYLGKSMPDLEVIITNDTKQNAVYGGRTVFTRQLQTLLSKKRGDPKAIIVTITKSLVNTVIPITPLTPGYPVGGWTSSSRHTYERNISPTKIDDLSEGGITLVNIPYSDTNFLLSDPPIMAYFLRIVFFLSCSIK